MAVGKRGGGGAAALTLPSFLPFLFPVCADPTISEPGAGLNTVTSSTIHKMKTKVSIHNVKLLFSAIISKFRYW